MPLGCNRWGAHKKSLAHSKMVFLCKEVVSVFVLMSGGVEGIGSLEFLRGCASIALDHTKADSQRDLKSRKRQNASHASRTPSSGNGTALKTAKPFAALTQ